jgi:hypothetical protein
VCDPVRRFRFFQKSDNNDFEQSKALFRRVYDTYALEVDENNEEEVGQNTPSSSSGKSSFMRSLHDHSDEEDSIIESSNEFDRYFIQRKGTECGKVPKDVHPQIGERCVSLNACSFITSY